ncbi:hypothetical protein ZEAMMB73_Zm00001d036281 [Zea mays]|uniref:Uncharacterized protein n=1 Tax=Zea mays TaxID=4577 RepID=A0A1D6LLH0_MAIZE|nr:hypothetical protein ZEAMMB73_Zm00001d036281 [Zea mays]
MVVIYHPQLSRTGFYSASARLPFHSPNGILHYYGILLHYYAWTIFDGRNGILLHFLTVHPEVSSLASDADETK